MTANESPTLPQKATLEELILRSFERFLSEVCVAKPGQIISYDDIKGLAKVKPGFKIKPKGSLNSVDLPSISGVPVVFPQGAWGSIKWNLVPGDSVLLIFSDRSMDSWESGSGDSVLPGSARQHSISDAIAIPGLFPSSKINPRFFKSAGLEINVKGTVAIGNGQIGTVTGVIPPTVPVELINMFDALIQLLLLICASPTPSTGSPLNTTQTVALNQLKTLIDQLKAN